ncbi:hypothetical protein L917_19798, partial [Phytophthora nicotianae]
GTDAELATGSADREDKFKEKRAGLPGPSRLGDLAFKLALKLELDPHLIFQRLPIVRAGGKLDNNPKIIQWFQYVI